MVHFDLTVFQLKAFYKQLCSNTFLQKFAQCSSASSKPRDPRFGPQLCFEGQYKVKLPPSIVVVMLFYSISFYKKCHLLKLWGTPPNPISFLEKKGQIS